MILCVHTMPEHRHTVAEVPTRDSMAAPAVSVMQHTGNCNHDELSPASFSTSKRPCTLTLERNHRRVQSNDSSGETTPASDPPLISPAALEPPQTSPSQKQPVCAAQGGLSLRSGLMINGCSTDVQRHLCSRMIADRLRTLGDQYERQHGEHQLESWLSSLIFNQNPASTFSTLPQKVSEIFRIGYYLLKMLTADLGLNVNKLPREDMYRQWTLFERLWDIVMKTVSPWIWEHGEWMAFQQGIEGLEDNSTASATAAPAPAVSGLLNH